MQTYRVAGNRLTMVDVVLTLDRLGWQGNITAISRHGMLPKSHFRGIAYEDYLPENAESLGLGGLVNVIQNHCNLLRQMSQDPAIAIDKLRLHTQRLWMSLATSEKRKFLERYSATWSVTRHRIATSVHEVMTDALDMGRLRILPGTIEQIESREQGIDVLVREGDGTGCRESGDLVINCTGPQASFSKAGVALFDNLLARGLVRCDPLDMGIEVDDDLSVIEDDGRASTHIDAIGPLLKGSLWETTAVPELRGQAMRVAEILLQREPAEVAEEDVIEYYI